MQSIYLPSNRLLSSNEESVLECIQAIVGSVLLIRGDSGVDPTDGTLFFGLRDLSRFTQTGYEGLSTTIPRRGQFPIPGGVIGPLKNSCTGECGSLGPDNIFFVPFSP